MLLLTLKHNAVLLEDLGCSSSTNPVKLLLCQHRLLLKSKRFTDTLHRRDCRGKHHPINAAWENTVLQESAGQNSNTWMTAELPFIRQKQTIRWSNKREKRQDRRDCLMGKDSIGFLCLKLRTTLLLLSTRARSVVTKKLPDKWQYKLDCTS